jgi:ABC-type branched-subunit amino acid transport system substrate-binding protein
MTVRNKLFAALVALLAFVCLAAFAGSAQSAKAEPLRIALIPPSGGSLAVFGRDAVSAWEYAAKEANAKGGVDGHRVVLVKGETDGQPATTVRIAQKLTQGGARFIGSVITSPENGALQQQLTAMNALSFNGLGKDPALTGEQCSPNAFRVVQNTTMDMKAVAQAIKKLPAKRWAIQAVDYSTGHSSAEEFKAAAQSVGKQIVLEQYAPLGTSDFGSYITKLKETNADGLFSVEFGADGVAFVNQGDQFKLFDKFKNVVGLNMVSEPLFPVLGQKIVGFYNNVGYDRDENNKLNKAFVSGYTKFSGKAPYYIVADNYLAAQTLFVAVKKAKSADPAKVRKALNGITFDSIVGRVTMAKDHQLVRPSYVGIVVEKDGGLGWEIVASVPGNVTHPKADPSCKV